MPFCKNCGQEINENQTVCLNCDESLQASNPQVVDDGGLEYGILGFCCPILGLFLLANCCESKPKSAKAAEIGISLGICVSILLFIIICYI